MHVATKMAAFVDPSLTAPTAETYARAAVRHIGYEPRSCPYWTHSVMWFLISMLPESVVDIIRMNMCIKIRRMGQAMDGKKKVQ